MAGAGIIRPGYSLAPFHVPPAHGSSVQGMMAEQRLRSLYAEPRS